MSIITLLSMSNFTLRNNQVIETHENYVIGGYNNQKILIYTDEVYFENETFELTEEIQEITSLSNFNLFNFQKYMNQQNIYKSTQNAVFTPKSSTKRNVYEKIKSLDNEISSMLLRIFYQYGDQDDFIYSSGMHLSFLNLLFFTFFNKYLSKKTSRLLTIFMGIIISVIFPFRFAMLRIFINNMIQLCFENKSKYEKLAYWMIGCMILYPGCSFSMSFLIPFVLRLNQLFIEKSKCKITQLLSLTFLQFLMTSKCSIISLLCFSLIQKLNSFSFVLGLLQIQFPNKMIHSILYIIENILKYINHMNIYGHIPILIVLVFLYFLLYSKHSKKEVICLLCLLYVPFQNIFNPFYRVLFLNVGQGDSVLILSPFNRSSILIDLPKNKEDIVIDTLHSLGIHHLDKVVATHGDQDHSGGIEALVEKFSVHEVIYESTDLRKDNMQLYQVNKQIYDNENDNSLVYFGYVGSLNYCFMGDVSIRVEEDLVENIEFKCDILKVGHHGSKTSTSALFLQETSPTLAYISASKNNRYGHPHIEVIELLDCYEVETIESFKDGAFEIKSLGRFNFIRTSEKEFDIIITE